MTANVPTELQHFNEKCSLNRCEICGLAFQSPQELAAHLYHSYSLDQDVILYFMISRCIKPFPLNLMQSTAPCFSIPDTTTEDVIRCNECDKVFKNEKGLKQHTSKVHVDLKSFGCWTCGKKYRSKHALITHYQKHKIPNQSTCEICSKVCLLYTSPSPRDS